MMPELATEVQRMAAMTVGQLQDRYAELWKHAPRSRNRTWLTRKIAWRLQMLAESGLSQRARERAATLAEDAPLRSSLPTRLPLTPLPTPAKRGSSRDSRLPEVGTVIVREYQGRRLQVLVLENGLEFEGNRYRSLSAVATAITGSHINGFRFFHLETE